MAKKEAKTSKKENSKNKKSFSKDFKAELKKVVWPTPKQLLNNTVAVITIVLITAIIVFVLDLAFEFLNKQGVEKVKEVITTSNTTDTNSTSQENTQSDENSKSEREENVVEENENVENTTSTEVEADQNN